MKIKTFILAAVMALGTCTLNAHASLWTVTTQGTIDYGYDSNGLFGVAGQDLAGLTFTQSITADTDPAHWQYSANGSEYSEVYGSGPGFTDTVTINGNSVTFAVNAAQWGNQYLMNGATQYGSNSYWYDEIYSYQEGYTADGRYISAVNDGWSNASFVPSLDFSQSLFNDQVNLYAYFYTSGDQGYAYFQGYNNMSFISLNGTNVPEPGSLALLGLGLAGLVALRRKQS